ncbi:GNAT family N-acetyltransferase [Butyrivibrio sp. AE3006]|uniref:GNAT family N-acetyltransferase n=1 Tax=Butyrivibrio sp. AE3006 TaxID=1280673 RepID=UPI000418936B|nr:GNAT family N-acetyltransferase [Butyrivibrio sp. AE3006]
MKLVELNASDVERIYTERLIFDFPRDEQKPLDVILKAMDKGIYECLGLWYEDEVIGYAFLVKKDKDYLIDYLAISPKKRNQGIGGKALQLLSEYFADVDTVILEIEDPDRTDDAAEKELQLRRRAFYLRNNCKDTGVRAFCFQVPFQILVLGQNKTEDLEKLKELYQSFYRMVLPKEIFDENMGDFY